ncbi:TetR/AcrR family transcriptional regulator [Conexibacter sp. SYSU D00693]|uniref:TetR/AcrR family transcriptional regulator n=1 Tax=Conexibacter sp. SYSU D00693 TaxID=2812560 RepID=UPI001F11D6B1|nr:TetR/AcrR family transcriptional regulator [Conexibacter sp. SYSU D00693]
MEGSSEPELGKRERTKHANRRAILDAAREVFAEMGFGAASVRDVVRRTDLASGTFYNYFPDKEAVLGALVDEAATEARERIVAARRSAESLDDFVRAGFRAYYAFLVEDPRTFELLRRNAGTIRAMFDQPVLGGGIDELEQDLRAGIAAGLLPEHDVELMASAMVGAGFEVGVRLLERAGGDDLEAAVELLADVFVAGFEHLARPEGSRPSAGLSRT